MDTKIVTHRNTHTHTLSLSLFLFISFSICLLVRILCFINQYYAYKILYTHTHILSPFILLSMHTTIMHHVTTIIIHAYYESIYIIIHAYCDLRVSAAYDTSKCRTQYYAYKIFNDTHTSTFSLRYKWAIYIIIHITICVSHVCIHIRTYVCTT
jgi:hypothetical protein